MHVIFCIPAIDNSGPSKGLVALANKLNQTINVSIIYFKNSDQKSNTELSINKDIKILRYNRLNKIQLLAQDSDVYLISMCFSSDLLSLWYFPNIRKVCFVRGNLFQNYKCDYGVLGYILALFHYVIIRFYSNCFVLNDEELHRVRRFGITATIIPNCLDEITLGQLSFEKQLKWDFIFVGNLNHRKRPDLILKSLYQLSLQGLHYNTIIVGDGPMRAELEELSENFGLSGQVLFTGEQPAPYKFLAQSKVFVFPSTSEGTSRALMEAAYFGNVSVIRNLECNRDFANQKVGFKIFKADHEIAAKMRHALSEANANGRKRMNFLPQHLEQKKVASSILHKLQAFGDSCA